MQKMTAEECRAFLREGQKTAKLATVRKDGRPHVVPIWFDLDGDDLVFTTWHTSVKAANMRRDHRVSVCVDEEHAPYAFVQIEGTAAIDEEAGDLLLWATRIAERYMGPALAEAYGKRNAVKGEFLVRVSPSKVIAQKAIAD